MSTTTKMTGAERIAAERQRQIEVEGWTPEHDADHVTSGLAEAAAVYATPSRRRHFRWTGSFTQARTPTGWPWHADYWKPTPDDRVRELEKAGALIAAEIDRLLAEAPR